MTTAWSHLVRGDVASSMRSNVGGALLCGLAIAMAPWAVASGVRGRWTAWTPTEGALLGVAALIIAVTLSDYLVRNGTIDWLYTSPGGAGARSERWNVHAVAFPPS
jgi:hypothetical protein